MDSANEIKNRSLVINAAGKMTALGGSAQHIAVAEMMADAATVHVDLALLRKLAGEKVANITGAESACITTGAAAGICIGIAAILTGQDAVKVQQIPHVEGENRFLLQAGHAVNFGATVEQMISLGGGQPVIVGSKEKVSVEQLENLLGEEQYAGFVYVKSHHCVQENMIDFLDCARLCREHEIPILVDAAAEEDLRYFISEGADLVTYSGGKAIGGPTSGFIAGKESLVAACEMQFQGIARPMKVGKEQILGLISALERYESREQKEIDRALKEINNVLLTRLQNHRQLDIRVIEDQAGRNISRVAVGPRADAFNLKDLVVFLVKASPSIRTRNHKLQSGYIQIDPREIDQDKAHYIADKIEQFLQ